MGWQDRQYAPRDDYERSVRPVYRGSGMGAYDVVTKLIIANIIVYFFHHGFGARTQLGMLIAEWGVMQAKAVFEGEIWRLFTATYLHANFLHIFFNMFVLYMFGPMVERRWGSRQFFIVYTLGGVVANVVLALVGLVHEPLWVIPGLGASGSVMTIIAAGAVLYPNTEVLVYFLFPLRLRTVAFIYAAGFAYNIYKQGANYGGDICHLAGFVVGYWWAKTGGWAWASGVRRPKGPVRPGFGAFFSGARPKKASFREKVEQRRTDAATVDRILSKVSENGVHSLTQEERAILRDATERLKAHESSGETVDRY